MANRLPLQTQANRQIANMYPTSTPTAALFEAYMVRILILIRPVMTFAYAPSGVVKCRYWSNSQEEISLSRSY